MLEMINPEIHWRSNNIENEAFEDMCKAQQILDHLPSYLLTSC